ncbi:MAG: ribulose-phosphate 3-epimerase [Bacteriovorax sp.]|jgi:ribulose-phosphate 3-epimerase
MTIISPSLLACDFLNIESELSAFNGHKDLWFHLDIMDGHFVPNLTFGHPIVEQIVKRSSHKCDAHFMVTNPEFYAETLSKSGIHNFTFHLEATLNALTFIHKLKLLYPSVGISIKPGTPVHKLSDDILKNVDLVLVMSVEPGFGGQSFMPSAYDKIRELKSKRDNLKAHFQIQVDGGISDKNAKELIEAGADNLVAGSYIFKNSKENYKKAIDLLR